MTTATQTAPSLVRPEGGLFISFESGEGAGKTTQVGLLQEALLARGLPVVRTREPGGSPGAEQIRTLVVQGAADRWSPATETLLFAAARRDHLEKTVLPALGEGGVVVTDRYFDSTRAYQGEGKGIPAGTLLALHRDWCGDIHPDLTVVLDIEPRTGLARAAARNGSAAVSEDRFEGMDLSFHERLRACFLGMAAASPGRYAVIDAAGTPAEVHARVLAAVDAAMARRGFAGRRAA